MLEIKKCGTQTLKKLKKILLVDDDEPTNFLNKVIIRHAGCAEEVVSNTTAKGALAYLREAQAAGSVPELILVDINMPIMDGWDFVERYANLEMDEFGSKVIMLTSSINPEDEQKAKQFKEIAGFRSKPLSQEMLDEILNEHFLAN